MNEYQDQVTWFVVEEHVASRWQCVEDHPDRDTAEARRDYLSGVLAGKLRVRRVRGLA